MNLCTMPAYFRLGLAIFLTLATLTTQGQITDKATFKWQSTTNISARTDTKVPIFNYHKATHFNELGEGSIFDLKKTKKLSFFAVFAAQRPSDLFRIKHGNHTVRFTDEAVINTFPIVYTRTEEKPKILFYHGLLRTNTKNPDTHLIIGSENASQQVVDDAVSEVIAFDRIIKIEERRRIESYLAMKYGIPLPDTVSYLDGNGNELWKGNREGKFRHSLISLGTDLITGLNQRQALNTYDDARISLSLGEIKTSNDENPIGIDDGDFLFMAHNAGNMTFKNINDDAQILQRTWKITANENFTDLRFYIHRDDLQLADSTMQFYYAVYGSTIDDIGNGKNCRWIRLKEKGNHLFGTTSGFEVEGNQCTYIGIIATREEGIKSEIVCKDDLARLTIKLSPQFDVDSDVNLAGPNKQSVIHSSSSERSFIYEALPFGTYNLTVSQSGQLSNRSIEVSKRDCNLIEICALRPNPVLVGQETTIDWLKPATQDRTIEIYNIEGKLLKSITIAATQVQSTISVDFPGHYEIKITQGDSSQTLTLIAI